MSNIYIQEPPTNGKVLLKTSVGDIDLELWCKETPKSCKNFIQLCMEGYYNSTIFHRVVQGFIVQGGDPNGDGTGGESIYGQPFKDEFHSRLRFARRGLVAMANSGPDDNGSQFFFTMGAAPELQNKHTIFGKVTGDTIFNMLKLAEGVVDHNEKPQYPNKIIKTEILLNPFDDIVPRKAAKRVDENIRERNTKKKQGVKNFGLLSFGEEAEVDEDETNEFVQKVSGKSKSTHDVLDDPHLSQETGKSTKNDDLEEDMGQKMSTVDIEDTKNKIREKLSSKNKESKSTKVKELLGKPADESLPKQSDSDSDDYENVLNEEQIETKRKKKEEIRNEIHQLKKQYKKERIHKDIQHEGKDIPKIGENSKNEMIRNYLAEQSKYSNQKTNVPKKGAAREQQTLELLSKFKNKLQSLRNDEDNMETDVPSGQILNDEEKDIQSDNWLKHTLRFEDKVVVLAKDASTKKDDWYDVFDPRNPINKRKRGESSGKSNKKFKE